MSGQQVPLRVLIDATSIPADRGGVGRYLEQLIPALARRDDLRLVVAVQERDAAEVTAAAPGADVVVPLRGGGRLRRLVWEQFGLPRLVRAHRVDVLHSPHYTMPVFTRVPVVVTVHDATFFSHPEVHTRFKRWFFRNWSRWSARSSAAIVVPSHATERELRRYARTSAPVVVAYHGVDHGRFHAPAPADVTRLADVLGLDAGAWIAFLGTVEPRKNVANLVRAYAALRQERELPPLVIAGARGWDEETGAVVAGLEPGVDVRLVGYLDAELLPAFLGGSEFLVYPSLGEGFGLPVLEAMACGAPVLTTRELALPEVGGDAVAYTATDAASIAQSMAELLDAPDRRRELAGLAAARAAQFTWDASADAHAHAFRIAGGRP